jgi:Domain of unknown function (DUF4402)
MKNFIKHTNHLFIKIFLVTALSVMSASSYAQSDTIPPDPGAIVVYTIQDLSFGAFTIGNTGGTVIIASNGSRSVTGDVVALNLGTLYHQSIFDIDGPQGTIVSIINGADATLTGSNGGSIYLHLGNSDPPSPFIITVTQPARTQVNIGGTLTLGSPAANPPGTYNGTFYITFNQE